MAYEHCQVDAIGVEIIVTILDDNGDAEDISAATDLKLHFKHSTNGATAVEVNAVFDSDGSDGKLKYAKADSDNVNNAGGKWFVQPEFTLGAFSGRTAIAEYIVDKNL